VEPAVNTRSFRGDTLYVAIPKIAGGVATIFLHLYAIRHLDPATYGAFGLCLTCLVIFESFVGSALDLGVLREAPLLRGGGTLGLSSLERSALVIKLGVGIVLLAIVALCGDWLSALVFHQREGRSIFAALVIAGTGVLLVRSVQVSFQVSQRFRLFGATDLAHTWLRVMLVCGLISAGGASVASLMVAYAVAAVAVATGFGILLLKDILNVSWVNLAECRKLAKYGSGVLVVGALGTILDSGDMFSLAVLSTPEEMGIYKAGLIIALLPELFGTYLAQVFSPRIMTYCKDGVFYRFFMKLQIGAFTASAVILVTGLLLTRPIISVLFPDRYGASIAIVMILLPAGIAGLIAFPVVVNFLAFFALRKLFVVDCIMVPFVVVAYYYAAKGGGAHAVAGVTSISRLIKAITLHIITVRIARRMEFHNPAGQAAGQRLYGLTTIPAIELRKP
jgi:O-antigen/teichoic acid export membrane protein